MALVPVDITIRDRLGRVQPAVPVWVYVFGLADEVPVWEDADGTVAAALPLLTNEDGRVAQPDGNAYWYEPSLFTLTWRDSVGDLHSFPFIPAGTATSSPAIDISDVTGLTAALAAKEAQDVNLDQLAGLSGIANRLPYFSGTDVLSLATFTSKARELVDDADAATMRGTLGAQGSMDWILPEDYGAVGNGTGDDSGALNAAIAAAVGKVLYLRNVYRCTGIVNLVSNTHVVARRGARIVAGAATVYVVRNDNAGGAGNTNIVIDGLEIDGGDLGGTDSVLYFQGVDHLRIRNCHLHDGIQQGMKFNACSNVSVLANEVRDMDQDGIIFANDNVDVLIEGNHSHHNGDDDIAINSEVLTPGTGRRAERVTIVGNVCGHAAGETASGQGIACRGGQQITIAGNTVFGPWDAGIMLNNGDKGTTPGVPLEDVACVGNVIRDVGRFGGSGGYGIRCHAMGGDTGQIRRVVIANNVIRTPKGHGINLADDATAAADHVDVAIVGNIVTWDTTASWPVATSRGINLEPSGGRQMRNVLVANNIVRSAPAAGIRASGGVLYLVIEGNKCNANGVDTAAPGIEVVGAVEVAILGNQSIDTQAVMTQTYGVRTDSVTGSLVIAGNLCGLGAVAGNATARFNIVSPASADAFRFRDNPGVQPWADTVTTATGAWTLLNGVYYKDVAVTFSIAFAQIPRVTCTPTTAGYAVSLVNLSATGFTARIFRVDGTDPGSAVNVATHWHAEAQS